MSKKPCLWRRKHAWQHGTTNMISKEAKKEWLNQPMEDWTFVKDMSNKELWSELQYQIDGPAQRGWGFKTEPRHHQLAAFLIGTYNQEFLYYMDMGLGKTKLSLDLLYYYQVKGQMDRAGALRRLPSEGCKRRPVRRNIL